MYPTYTTSGVDWYTYTYFTLWTGELGGIPSTPGGRLSETVQGPLGDAPAYQTPSWHTQNRLSTFSTEKGVLTP